MVSLFCGENNKNKYVYSSVFGAGAIFAVGLLKKRCIFKRLLSKNYSDDKMLFPESILYGALLKTSTEGFVVNVTQKDGEDLTLFNRKMLGPINNLLLEV